MVDDVHEGTNHWEDFEVILKRSGTGLVSDTLSRQEMPLKPEVFHGRDDLVEGIMQFLLQEKPLASAFSAQVGWGRLLFTFRCRFASHQRPVPDWKRYLGAMH